MVLAALVVGLVAGFGSVIFRAMIAGIHNLLFLGQLSLSYDASVHTAPAPWGYGIILAPVLGALGVAFLVKTFAPEAKGHGVPEVMDAIYYRDGKIRAVVVAVKSLASALSIGSGGSVGREGPIIQIGAAFASTVGQLIPMPVRQRATLMAAGAAGGIAATFNTPVGGIVFAIELMMPFVSPMSLLVVALSCVMSTLVGRHFFGAVPSFNVPALAQVEGSDIALAIYPAFALFGLLMGLTSALMVRSIYWFEDFFDALPGNYYTRHALGMLLVGLIMAGFMHHSTALGQPNHYYIQGVGYATIMDILRGDLTAVGFLLLLAVAKLLVTSLTLGSGASGGVFSPSLFIGAALGGCVGGVFNQLFPGLGINPVHFAYAGMAATIGGTTGAAVTATIMVFELTRDYTAIVPVILTVSVAGALRYWLSAPTIYTLKLLRRGDIVPQGLQAWMGEQRARDVMTADFKRCAATEARDEDLVREALRTGQVVVLIGPAGTVAGVIDPQGQCGAPTPYVSVPPDQTMLAVLRQLDQAEARVALVMDREGIAGVITERHITRAACAMARLTG